VEIYRRLKRRDVRGEEEIGRAASDGAVQRCRRQHRIIEIGRVIDARYPRRVDRAGVSEGNQADERWKGPISILLKRRSNCGVSLCRLVPLLGPCK
jgi:hypothetical protein